MSDWQPIETAPRDGRLIVLSRESNIDDLRHCVGYWEIRDPSGGFRMAGIGIPWKGATHWMPIPNAPP